MTPEIGIYVPGDLYDGLHWSTANYSQKGRAWERPVHVEFFETGGEQVISQEAGVRIQGSATRYRPAKSLRLYARSAYGARLFEHPVLGASAPSAFRRFLLRPGGQDDQSTMLRDGFMAGLGKSLGLDVQSYRPSIVFLNGEYWGIHNIRESLDEDYFYRRHGVPEESLNRIMMRSGTLIVESGTIDHYHRLLDFVAGNDLNDSRNFSQVATMMDVGNYIDYYCAEIFFDNRDWPRNNIAHWRVERPSYEPGMGVHDGRWRWILWDMDRGWGTRNRNDRNGLVWASEGEGEDPGVTLLFRSLLQSAQFSRQFILRFADHLNTVLNPRHFLPILEDYRERVAGEMPRHIARWKRIESPEQWEVNIERMRDFGQHRPAFQRQHIIDFFGLSGMSRVTLDVSDKQGGAVRINTLTIGRDTPGLADLAQPYPWTGVYFHDVPVEIEAIPAAGYRFAGWQGREETAKRLTLVVSEDLELTAVFEFDEGELEDLIPSPHDLSSGPYRLMGWDREAAAGSYPAHMIFEQTKQKDPLLGTPMEGYWTLPYNLDSRSRINGLGEEGISFVNTGKTQDHPEAGFVGAAVLGLNTLGQENIDIAWTGGTVTPNRRPYALRLQYRVGRDAAFTDVLTDAGEAVEYVWHPEAGHQQHFDPVRLPLEAENVPYIQLRWKYYYLEGGSGPRARLRLDDIAVSSATRVRDSYAAWLERVFPDPADRDNVDIAGPGADPWGEGIPNYLRYALEIDPREPGRGRLPQAEVVDGRLSLVFQRDPSKADIAYVVEASSDLADWSEVLYDSRLHLQENTDGESMRIADSADLSGAGGRRFLRLAIVAISE